MFTTGKYLKILLIGILLEIKPQKELKIFLKDTAKWWTLKLLIKFTKSVLGIWLKMNRQNIVVIMYQRILLISIKKRIKKISYFNVEPVYNS